MPAGLSSKRVPRPQAKTQVGNGDWCPKDPEHGIMYMLSSGRQYCPHQSHDAKATRHTALFEYDGTTPVNRGVRQ